MKQNNTIKYSQYILYYPLPKTLTVCQANHPKQNNTIA